MELRTYTGLWKVEKRLYKFYDISLPYPVSVKQIGIFLGVGIPWLALMNVLGVPFAPPFGHVLWLAPPALLAWWSNRPVAEGKSLVDYVVSQVGFFLGHKSYVDMAPESSDPKELSVHVATWSPGHYRDSADEAG